MLGLYILIIYTSPLYIQIITSTISRLTTYYNYKDRLIALLIIKYTRIATFSLYRSQNPQWQYINYMQELQYGSYKARIQYYSRSRLSRRGLTRQQFILLQLYYIIDRQLTPSKGPSPLLYSLLLLFLLFPEYLGFLSLISTPQLLLILYRAFYSHILYSYQPF